MWAWPLGRREYVIVGLIKFQRNKELSFINKLSICLLLLSPLLGGNSQFILNIKFVVQLIFNVLEVMNKTFLRNKCVVPRMIVYYFKMISHKTLHQGNKRKGISLKLFLFIASFDFFYRYCGLERIQSIKQYNIKVL